MLVSLFGDDCMESRGAWNCGFTGIEETSFKEKTKDDFIGEISMILHV